MISHLLSIKTPQLIGIIAGCTVFVITIAVVIYLLYASGAFTNFVNEINSRPVKNTISKSTSQIHNFPMLYDELIKARETLPTEMTAPLLKGEYVTLTGVTEKLISSLVACSNGTAIFHESAYDPSKIWGWMSDSLYIDDKISTRDMMCNNPSDSELSFKQFYAILPSEPHGVRDFVHLVITDVELNVPIGMISLLNNRPRDLSIRLGRIWVTPAFQGQKRIHNGIHMVLKWLFELGYRRVWVETDSRNLIFRKFLERCGFQNEAILRKHKIFLNRNSDTCIYVILNSEWPEVDLKLKRYLGFSVKPTTEKAAFLDTSIQVKKP